VEDECFVLEVVDVLEQVAGDDFGHVALVVLVVKDGHEELWENENI